MTPSASGGACGPSSAVSLITRSPARPRRACAALRRSRRRPSARRSRPPRSQRPSAQRRPHPSPCTPAHAPSRGTRASLRAPLRPRARSRAAARAVSAACLLAGLRATMPRPKRNGETVDALPLDGVHPEDDPVVRHLVARLGGTSEQAEHESSDRVVVLIGQVDVELLVEVVDRERAVDPDRVVVDPLDGLVRQVELVLDLTDDLLDEILERDDPLDRAVLVDDDREVLVRSPEFP